MTTISSTYLHLILWTLSHSPNNISSLPSYVSSDELLIWWTSHPILSRMLSTVIHRATSHPLSFISSAGVHLILVTCISSTKIIILKMVNLCRLLTYYTCVFFWKTFKIRLYCPTQSVWRSGPISELEWSISSYLNPRHGFRLRLVYASCFFYQSLMGTLTYL